MKYKHKRQRLGIFGKALGTLSEMAQEDGFLIAEISGFNIVLPSEMEAKLAPLVGMQVGILHTNIPGKEYLVCSISESKSLALKEEGSIKSTPNEISQEADRGKARA